MSEQLPFDESITRFKSNEIRFDEFINDAVGYMTREGVNVESIRAFLARLEDEITGYVALGPRADVLETEMDVVEAGIAALVAEAAPIHDQIEATTSGDDKGLVFVEQISVGKPNAGREVAFGEGDSYPVPHAWHADYTNISGVVVTGATDITTELQSDATSTTGLFGGVTSGKCLILMSPHRFGGVKAKIDVAGDVDPNNVAMEYLFNDTPTWAEFPYMATGADFPYTQKGRDIGACSSCSEQWRFGFDPESHPLNWEITTVNINGTDHTGFFVILRTTSAITLDPVLEQIKLHTNRWECNADGNTEYFGRARYPKDLTVTKHTNADKNPLDENISIASGVTIVATDNEFTAAADDGNIYMFTIPSGMDTSIPVLVEKRFVPATAAAGDIKYNCIAYHVRTGDIIGALPVHASLSNIISVDNQQNELISTAFELSISDVLPGDNVVLDVYREGTHVDDTYGANIIDISGRVIGYFWRP